MSTVPEVEPGKPWYLSKTIWVNTITFALTSLGMATGDVGGVLESVDMEMRMKIAVGIITAVNVVLRLVTKEPVLKAKRPLGAK